MANCGYEREYALKLLHGQRGVRSGKHWGRKKVYEPKQLLPALKNVWLASDQLCSERLVAALPLWLEHDSGVAGPIITIFEANRPHPRVASTPPSNVTPITK